MPNITPTKANLLAAKRSLALAENGYELLDRKRVIMTREMLRLIDDVKEVQNRVSSAFGEAYAALRDANIALGRDSISRIIASAPIENDVEIRYRSVMGVEIPEVYKKTARKSGIPFYGLVTTSAELDAAYARFCDISDLTLELSSVVNSVYRLAEAIKKSRKRANALSNIVIPRLRENIAYIQDYLDEKERESFTAQKVVKKNKEKQNDN